MYMINILSSICKASRNYLSLPTRLIPYMQAYTTISVCACQYQLFQEKDVALEQHGATRNQVYLLLHRKFAEILLGILQITSQAAFRTITQAQTRQVDTHNSLQAQCPTNASKPFTSTIHFYCNSSYEASTVLHNETDPCNPTFKVRSKYVCSTFDVQVWI